VLGGGMSVCAEVESAAGRPVLGKNADGYRTRTGQTDVWLPHNR
jgi:hypothetical protein